LENRSRDLAYTRDALHILEHNLRLYREGASECYRAAAAQLRLLLCDTNRIHERLVDISLVPRLFPDLHLAALREGPPPSPADPGELNFQPGPGSLSLAEWLAQEIPIPSGGRISLRELIRTVCEQDGGAHVDQRPVAWLRGWEERGARIAELGTYILSALELVLS
jgi:hypothetical protein